MVNQLISLDNKLTLFFQNLFPHNRLFDLLFSFFSLRGTTVFIWIIIIILAIIFEEKKYPGISSRDKKFIISFILSLLITFFLVNVVLKNVIHRPRPQISSTNFNRLKLIPTNSCPTDFSFPSGHASISFAAATIISVFDKKRKWFYYLIATTIAYSRIYLGCHFFADVFFGVLLGYLISKGVFKLFST
ncbi:MAG: phosphatase PAP2 family protein [Microgenomates group bacterium]